MQLYAGRKVTYQCRGNSTWDWAKKTYRLKLSSATEILGMPASKHWVLLANYADRNDSLAT